MDEWRGGFTLMELALVVFVLGTVSVLATLRLGDVLERTRIRAAETDLKTLREGFMGTEGVAGYLADMGRLPGFSPAHLRVHNLLNPTNVIGRGEGDILLDDDVPREGYASFACFTNWNPETGRGWRGPYVRPGRSVRNTRLARAGFFPAPDDRRTESDRTFRQRGFYPNPLWPDRSLYGFIGEHAAADPWGNPYVLQIPPNEAFESATEERRFHYARLVSAGPDGVLQTPCLKGMDYLAFHDNPPSDPDAEPPPAPLWAALDGVGIADYRRALRLAGRVASGDPSNRGDDLVLFLNRPDIYERDE
jgi:hypothetical protein